MELCKTSGGYIAQYEHADRRKKWAARAGTLGDRPNYSPVPPAKSRIITIEMIVPTVIDNATIDVIADAVDRLATAEGGYADVVSDQHVEEDNASAVKLLQQRRCLSWKT